MPVSHKLFFKSLYFTGDHKLIGLAMDIENAKRYQYHFGFDMIPTLLRKKTHPLVTKLTPAIKYFGCMGYFGGWMLLISSGMMVYRLDCDVYKFCDENFRSLFYKHFWVAIFSAFNLVPIVMFVLGACLAGCVGVFAFCGYCFAHSLGI